MLQLQLLYSLLQATLAGYGTSSTDAAAGPRFHQNSGIWSETQASLQDRGGNAGLVTELDPDATTR